MKHTPGPWVVTKDGETTIREANGRRRMIARAYDIYGDRDPEQPSFRKITDELMPNARLIAAAPDLYAACRALLDDIDDEGEVLQFHRSLIDAIHAAVSRAEDGERD